eukprot:761852-Hanusia_phi.AAC.5
MAPPGRDTQFRDGPSGNDPAEVRKWAGGQRQLSESVLSALRHGVSRTSEWADGAQPGSPVALRPGDHIRIRAEAPPTPTVYEAEPPARLPLQPVDSDV